MVSHVVQERDILPRYVGSMCRFDIWVYIDRCVPKIETR